MKTPREILFEKHQAALPKLEDARNAALAEVMSYRLRAEAQISNQKSEIRNQKFDQSLLTSAATNFRHTLGEVLSSFRWHVAALGAAWIVILVLNAEPSPSSAPQALASGHSRPATDLLASLRQNRRQILDLLDQTSPPTAPPPPTLPAPRRSERENRSPFVYV